MGAISGLWRWRHNPLRRGTDLAEAWSALAALLFAVLAAPVIGCLVGAAAQDSLQRSVRAQQQSRHPVTADVVRALDRAPPDGDPAMPAGADPRSRVLARWTAPDGTARSGPVTAYLKSPRPGDRFGMWTDDRGRAVARPPDPAAATTHAVLAGIGAALVAAGLAEGCRRLTVRRMVRRRYAAWDRAWERAGPDRGLTGAGG
ncbi:Rv1733c family protein [Streptomyces griseoflavus]|uniref:Rv1733c family protein n=1 Tax=Streptomyces griseoflavus TaxID=35619 RepID=UPI003D716257